MAIISYAQNFEDVLLSRVLGSRKSGFYVDVGAYDPSNGSVTRHFYEAGWHGINIEPGPIFESLEAERPRDVNLKVAISDHAGKQIFFEHPEDPGTSTLSEELHPNLESRISSRLAHTVEVLTLADVLEEHAGEATIDFLKIDVEGHERQVLLGNDWQRFRPRVVLIEATLPYSNDACHEEWEQILLDADYQFAFFDGLNRYYVRGEDEALLPRFQIPVNALDDFEMAQTAAQRKEIDRLHGTIDRVKAFADRADEIRKHTASQLAEEKEQRSGLEEEFEKLSAEAHEREQQEREARASLDQEIQRLHQTISRVDQYAQQADSDREKLRSQMASLTKGTGPKTLKMGLYLARTVHRIGRKLGLARTKPAGEFPLSPVGDAELASQLRHIYASLTKIEDRIEQLPAGRSTGDAAQPPEDPAVEANRLTLLLLKMAQAGHFGDSDHEGVEKRRPSSTAQQSADA